MEQEHSPVCQFGFPPPHLLLTVINEETSGQNLVVEKKLIFHFRICVYSYLFSHTIIIRVLIVKDRSAAFFFSSFLLKLKAVHLSMGKARLMGRQQRGFSTVGEKRAIAK